jgi:gamma-glutamyltranspeptidase/glutathione hydrolase
VRELKPIECDYRGYHVISAPPPSSGGVAICQALNILQGYDLRRMGFRSAAEVHVLVEACAGSTSTATTSWATPTSSPIPSRSCLDPAYAAKLRAGIDPTTPRRRPRWPGGAGARGPQHHPLQRARRQGNAVSVTYTLNDGSGHIGSPDAPASS